MMDRPAPESEEFGAQDGRDELAKRIARTVREDGRVETLEGLHLNRSSSPTEMEHGVSTPAFCVIAQGTKEILVGGDRYRYDPNH